MNTQAFFSVIIPSFNRRRFLDKAAASVLEQSFTDFELIIVDDGSTDGTEELVRSYKDKRIRYFYQDQRGVSNARNKGLAESKGAFIAFLDSDDHWVRSKLRKASEYIREYPRISIFHTEEIWYRDGRLLGQKKKHRKPSGHVYKKALPLCCISISTAVISREVFDLVGTFDESLEACEDYDFWLRAALKYEVKLIPEELTIKDGGRPDQLSSSVWGLDRFRIKALEKMLRSGLLKKDDYKVTLKELKKKCDVFSAGCKKRGKMEESEYYGKLADRYDRPQTSDCRQQTRNI